MATMRAARMYGYKQPLRLEEVNEHIDALGRGDFVGRAVIAYD